MNIAILGLGTIGSGVYELLKANQDINVKRVLDIRAWMDIMTTDLSDITGDSDIDAVVETMGGLHPAYEYALSCINSGKSFITANKDLVSEYGRELAAAAKTHHAAFLFSAACGGGIPYLSNLAKARSTDKIKELGGILNGTTNYILDKMHTSGESYDAALAEAQKLGYAERDPSSDVDGLDTQRKLALACGVGVGRFIKPADIPTFGIRNISRDDIMYASKQNAVIRLAAYARFGADATEAFVIPRMFKQGSAESSIRLNLNYAWYTGEQTGIFAFSGQGAGRFPTAANIIRDLYAVKRGETALYPEQLAQINVSTDEKYSFYIRLPFGKETLPEAAIKEKLSASDSMRFITEPMTVSQASQIREAIPDSFIMLI